MDSREGRTCGKCGYTEIIDDGHRVSCTTPDCGLGYPLAASPEASRKIIQLVTCPLSTVVTSDDTALVPTTNTLNGVFALCDDGTVWLQIMGGGGEWTPIDGVPQGDFEELNTLANQDTKMGN